MTRRRRLGPLACMQTYSLGALVCDNPTATASVECEGGGVLESPR
jgi:hypothetical protein